MDARGGKVAAISDIIVQYGKDEYPPLVGLVARYRRRNFFIPRRDIGELDLRGAKLRSTVLDLTPFTRRDGEVLLWERRP